MKLLFVLLTAGAVTLTGALAAPASISPSTALEHVAADEKTVILKVTGLK